MERLTLHQRTLVHNAKVNVEAVKMAFDGSMYQSSYETMLVEKLEKAIQELDVLLNEQ